MSIYPVLETLSARGIHGPAENKEVVATVKVEVRPVGEDGDSNCYCITINGKSIYSFNSPNAARAVAHRICTAIDAYS